MCGVFILPTSQRGCAVPQTSHIMWAAPCASCGSLCALWMRRNTQYSAGATVAKLCLPCEVCSVCNAGNKVLSVGGSCPSQCRGTQAAPKCEMDPGGGGDPNNNQKVCAKDADCNADEDEFCGKVSFMGMAVPQVCSPCSSCGTLQDNPAGIGMSILPPNGGACPVCKFNYTTPPPNVCESSDECPAGVDPQFCGAQLWMGKSTSCISCAFCYGVKNVEAVGDCKARCNPLTTTRPPAT